MKRKHTYSLGLRWTGNLGSGTGSYRDYSRSHLIRFSGNDTLEASSDPHFRGDPQKTNPEELFLASIASCHMLWYLHLCADAGVVVTEYSDNPTGNMEEYETGAGKFTEVELHPRVVITRREDIDLAERLHAKAHTYCFISNSLNFEVKHRAECSVAEDQS